MDYQEYETYFAEKVKKDKKVKMHLARLSVAPGTFLKEMYVTDYVLAREQGRLKTYSKLKEEELVALPKLMLGMSRYSEWGKDVFWDTQIKFFMESNGKYETRNNVMRSDSEFME